MGLRKSHLHNYPARVSTGLFILNSGINKIQGDDELAERVHSTAITAYPMLEDVPASTFVKVLGACEVSLGAALLMPFVPDRTAGKLMIPFAAGLLGLYLKIPGMRREGGLRPTTQGTSFAKDAWLMGIALSLALTRRPTKKMKIVEAQPVSTL